MTLTAFIPFGKKPTKNPASMLCKYTGMREHAPRDGSNVVWDFRGMGGRLGIQLIDLRDDMAPGNDEWAQTVGWDYNWAIAVRIADRKRTDAEYIYWHSLGIVLARAYDLDHLWLDSGTDTPQESYTFGELLPELKSADAEDMVEWTPEEGLEQPLPLPAVYSQGKIEPEDEVEDEAEEDERARVVADYEPAWQESGDGMFPPPPSDVGKSESEDEGDFWGDEDDDWDDEAEADDEDEVEDEDEDEVEDEVEDEDEDEAEDEADEPIRDPEPVTDW